MCFTPEAVVQQRKITLELNLVRVRKAGGAYELA